MKSLQFRSIAPKASVIVPSPSSAVLSCQPPPALPEATSGSSPKSIVVPAQNYALMQIAGQDGTFSLVALPPSVPPQAPQHRNLKLPIPRYKPVRRAGTDKVRSPPTATRVKAASRVAAAVMSGMSSLMKRKKQECRGAQKPKEEPSEMIFLDAARSHISVTALLADNAVLSPGSQLEQVPDNAEHPAAATVLQSPGPPATPLKVSPDKPQDQGGTATPTSQSKAPANSIALVSPTIFSKAVHIIPSPPKGKVPILPYSKVKSTLVPAGKLHLPQDQKDLLGQAGPVSPRAPASTNLKSFEARGSSPVPNSTLQRQMKSLLAPLAETLEKLPGKKRGRKRKTAEDNLAYEARKRRSLSFFCRRAPEKPSNVVSGSREEVEISKKYRSIRPKPILVMETLPQLVSLPARSSDAQEVELVRTPACPPQQPPVSLHLKGAYHPRVLLTGRSLHRCPTCNRCFQFKHHLQSHMKSHGRARPYGCPACRKAYAHSGSLSTHMKLHHAEARPRRSLCCEFCEKAFGYVGVYFSHLREVHKVLLTVEPSVSHHEDNVAAEGDAWETSEERHDDEAVELQIKCGRCQVVTATFADMKMHLVYVHGEVVPVRIQGGASRQGGFQAEKELVKRAAHYWQQLNEKKSHLLKCGSCDEEFFSLAKLKRHVMFRRCGSEGEHGHTFPPSDGVQGPGSLAGGSAFNCVLCSQVLDTKEQVLDHWRGHHRCERPDVLWMALSSYSSLEDLEDQDAYRDLDSVQSPH
uniref:zinc finger protein 438 n=1 Tax=Doryrhamphus excisus TaxID=161450 RepID=UPI0025AE6C1E|nr:zinc finger protein 438 [Doryrhamphus excisus]XP_057916058.1 zinc finger protein 438 [Doryrhamphus excisus]